MKITLTDDEKACGKCVARIRNTHNDGQTNIPGGETASPEERLKQHYVACLAEIGTSRMFNLAWTGCGKGSSGLLDVGGIIEVRSITEFHKGLLVRESDHVVAPYVLAYVESPATVSLVGWEFRATVQDNGVHRDADTENPYWTLEHKKLRKMRELWDLLDELIQTRTHA